MKRLSIKFRLSFAVLFLFHLGIFAAADAQQVIRGHVPSAISKLGLQPIGRMDSARQLRLAIGLPLRNQQSLTLLLKEMYDPASPSFRQYPDNRTIHRSILSDRTGLSGGRLFRGSERTDRRRYAS